MSILIPLDRIDDSPFQTRGVYDEAKIQKIAESIDRNGLIQVPPARIVLESGDPAPEAHYRLLRAAAIDVDTTRARMDEYGWRVQVAVGHTRLRSFRHLGRDAMPLELRPLTDEQMDMLAWSENHDRDDLSPVEEAQAIADRIDRHDWSQEEAAEHLGLGRSTVSNKLRLLKLPKNVLDHVATGSLTERKAMAILPAFTLDDELEAMLGAEATSPHKRGGDPRDRIFEEAIAGASSDSLRDQVARLTDWLTGLAQVARHCPPLLHISFEDSQKLFNISHAGIMYGTGGRPAKLTSYCQLSQGTLEPGDVRRFMITGHGSGPGESEGERREWSSARELLPAEQFEARDHGDIEIDQEHGYGKRLTITVEGEDETFVAGHRVTIAATKEEEKICRVGIIRVKSVRPRQKAADDRELEDESFDEHEDLWDELKELHTRYAEAEKGLVDDGESVQSADPAALKRTARTYTDIATEAQGLANRGQEHGARPVVDGAHKLIRRAKSAAEYMISIVHGREDDKEGLAVGGEQLVNADTGEALADHQDMEVGASYVPESRLQEKPDDFPTPVHPQPEWDEFMGYTKAQLEEVYEELRHPLHYRHSDDWRKSYLKPEMQKHIRGLLQFHANLRAAHLMTDDQVEVFAAWLNDLFEKQKLSLNPEGFPWGAWNFAKELPRIGKMRTTRTMPTEAWQRFRRAHLRHVASHVYHLFLEEVEGAAPAETPDDANERIQAAWREAREEASGFTNFPSANLPADELHDRSSRLKQLGKRCDQLSTEASEAGLDNLAKAIGETRAQIAAKQRAYASQITKRQEPEPAAA